MNSHTRTALVMSRLPRLALPDAPWLLGLRAGLRRIHDRGDMLLVGDGTAGCDFVRRGAELLGINWTIATDTEQEVADSKPAAMQRDGIPARDRTLVESADELLVLSLRDNGHCHQLLRERLNSGHGGVTFVDLEGLQSQAARNELLAQGASIWHPDPTQTELLGISTTIPARNESGTEEVRNDFSTGATRSPSPRWGGPGRGDEAESGRKLLCTPSLALPAEGREPIPEPGMNDGPSPTVIELVPFPNADGWAYLSHTTRACAGPWPQQSQDDYLDSLLRSRGDADHSPRGTLGRILIERRLAASARTARGGRRVVSLTATPLSQLPDLRRFRRHRNRWDFEPFGLCIRLDWLIERGTRPVLYGDDLVWQSLCETDQPYFQPAHSIRSAVEDPDAGIDWTVEREWRHVGDLDLSQLPREAGLVFVPDFAAARALSQVSPWPITLWPDPKIETTCDTV